MRYKKRSHGFSVIEALIVIVVAAVLVLGGWLVWRHNHQTKKAAVVTGSTEGAATKQTPANQPADPYAGWKTYNNAAYGIDLRYPSVWTLDEGSMDAAASSTKQEYAINLKRNENVKYNETATIEVLNEDLAAATLWYDSYFAQSASGKVNKTSDQLKGRHSVQYTVTNAGVETKLYLFEVGSKTYTFTSINEELNVQADTNYWTILGKVFDSMQIK
ncbi:MAG TPA: prepilin-type N-terminal cleavage/methylation domain-containing protein [Candidatus Saccharimonadales bacterium]|nr:prepilin-type N-terminal cleavage/methylation domain-containing protein [Candidatus Saccharimonadales bacterium]